MTFHLASARSALLISALFLAGSGAWAADDLKNLKVFPKDISKRELVDTMKQWSHDLGVRCEFCHLQTVPGDFQSIDYASDKIGHKDVARRMMKMVEDLNAGPLPRAAGEKDAAVSCITCHRGLPNPATLDHVLLGKIRDEGVAAGVAAYRQLREKYYGSGSYDFGPASLDPVIDALSREPGGMDRALVVIRLNLEMNPDVADSHVKLAQALLTKEDRAGAAAALEDALKLDPASRHALRLKQQMAPGAGSDGAR